MSKQSYFGLSLDERLDLSGNSQQFSQALQKRDERTLNNLLRDIDYSQDSARAIVKTFLEKR